MTQFEGFSEAARLFAENESVVDTMRQRLKDDAARFWSSVEGALADALAPERIVMSHTAGYTYYRVARDGGEAPSLWVTRADGRLVRSGEVLVGFGVGNASLVDAAVGLLGDLEGRMPDGRARRKQKPTATTVFELDLKLTSPDLVGSFCEQVVPTLRSLVDLGPPSP